MIFFGYLALKTQKSNYIFGFTTRWRIRRYFYFYFFLPFPKFFGLLPKKGAVFEPLARVLVSNDTAHQRILLRTVLFRGNEIPFQCFLNDEGRNQLNYQELCAAAQRTIVIGKTPENIITFRENSNGLE